MTRRQTPLLVHLLGAGLASALAAYWILRLLATPATAVLPVALTGPVARDPDPVLAARLFGDLTTATAVAAHNIQVLGVFAAGSVSAAAIAIDGHPARAILLGQEVASGLRLVEVHPDGVALQGDGGRTHYDVPPLSVAKAALAAPLFRRDGAVLTAPSLEPAPAARAATPAPVAPTGRSGGANMPGSGMLLPPPQRSPADEAPAPAARPGGFPAPVTPGS